MPETIESHALAITLREHLEGRISALTSHLIDMIRNNEESSVERQDSMRREILLIQSASQSAVDKAEQAQKLRNEAMNEWRQTIGDRDSKYATKEQVDATIDRIGRLEKFMWLLMGAFILLNLVKPYLPVLNKP